MTGNINLYPSLSAVNDKQLVTLFAHGRKSEQRPDAGQTQMKSPIPDRPPLTFISYSELYRANADQLAKLSMNRFDPPRR